MAGTEQASSAGVHTAVERSLDSPSAAPRDDIAAGDDAPPVVDIARAIEDGQACVKCEGVFVDLTETQLVGNGRVKRAHTSCINLEQALRRWYKGKGRLTEWNKMTTLERSQLIQRNMQNDHKKGGRHSLVTELQEVAVRESMGLENKRAYLNKFEYAAECKRRWNISEEDAFKEFDQFVNDRNVSTVKDERGYTAIAKLSRLTSVNGRSVEDTRRVQKRTDHHGASLDNVGFAVRVKDTLGHGELAGQLGLWGEFGSMNFLTGAKVTPGRESSCVLDAMAGTAKLAGAGGSGSGRGSSKGTRNRQPDQDKILEQHASRQAASDARKASVQAANEQLAKVAALDKVTSVRKKWVERIGKEEKTFAMLMEVVTGVEEHVQNKVQLAQTSFAELKLLVSTEALPENHKLSQADADMRAKFLDIPPEQRTVQVFDAILQGKVRTLTKTFQVINKAAAEVRKSAAAGKPSSATAKLQKARDLMEAKFTALVNRWPLLQSLQQHGGMIQGLVDGSVLEQEFQPSRSASCYVEPSSTGLLTAKESRCKVLLLSTGVLPFQEDFQAVMHSNMKDGSEIMKQKSVKTPKTMRYTSEYSRPAAVFAVNGPASEFLMHCHTQFDAAKADEDVFAQENEGSIIKISTPVLTCTPQMFEYAGIVEAGVPQLRICLSGVRNVALYVHLADATKFYHHTVKDTEGDTSACDLATIWKALLQSDLQTVLQHCPSFFFTSFGIGQKTQAVFVPEGYLLYEAAVDFGAHLTLSLAPKITEFMDADAYDVIKQLVDESQKEVYDFGCAFLDMVRRYQENDEAAGCMPGMPELEDGAATDVAQHTPAHIEEPQAVEVESPPPADVPLEVAVVSTAEPALPEVQMLSEESRRAADGEARAVPNRTDQEAVNGAGEPAAANGLDPAAQKETIDKAESAEVADSQQLDEEAGNGAGDPADAELTVAAEAASAEVADPPHLDETANGAQPMDTSGHLPGTIDASAGRKRLEDGQDGLPSSSTTAGQPSAAASATATQTKTVIPARLPPNPRTARARAALAKVANAPGQKRLPFGSTQDSKKARTDAM
eukprot:TRINITY_DN110946_c0_g1_i1.p1 TRINITY_DN110946_c0_g1~~TRINITY_DN110946_c0_g1_i1.p1  ORF type:complete len:1084 (+),score=214.37 TRINITY_DN110946_c0_g1_i1:63-3254(+)